MLRLDQRYFRSLILPFVMLLAVLAIAGYYLLQGMAVNHLWLAIAGFFGTVLVTTIWIAIRTSRLIRADVHRINESLDHLLAKEYDQTAVEAECCEELHTIARQITKVAAKLKKRDRQKAKYTKKLKRLTQQQGEIISAISHEFKNPVAAIIGYATTVHDDPAISPDLREKFLEKVITNSQRINSMIDRLSLAITFENNALEPRMESFDLSLLLEEIVDNLRQKYPNRVLDVEHEPTPVNADRTMMAQVLSNLIDNALKYSEETVTIMLKEGTFRVEDRGIGIEEDALGKITKRFYRANTQSWDNSIGVGLFIVEYILKLHDTKLEIKSTLGVGSTFSFTL